MRYALMVICALAALSFSVTADAAETGQIPNDMLAQFGMADMEQVSDAQGEEIRAKFFFGPQTFVGIAILANQSMVSQGVPPAVRQQVLIGWASIVLTTNDLLRAAYPGGFGGAYPPGSFILP